MPAKSSKMPSCARRERGCPLSEQSPVEDGPTSQSSLGADITAIRPAAEQVEREVRAIEETLRRLHGEAFTWLLPGQL